ncbi:MAG: hypothetical protein JNK81_14540 [Anaerolineales bacterium]|nr:hypothetical protein [Anaerolineales bacterium]
MFTKKALIPFLLFLVFFSAMAMIQFATPDMPDNDGFYHIKLAWLMRTESLKPEFDWLPLTILNAEEFYDHHFLYHVFLIPFTFGDLRLGAKWVAVFFSSLAFLSVWYLFHRQRVPHAWILALLLLGVSEAFLYRMSITRAQSLSLAMLALGLTWLLENKNKHLAVLSFLYVWMYNAFPLMPAFAFLYCLSVLIIDHKFDFKPFLWSSAGVVAGLMINPYFPDNLIFTYHHFLPKLLDTTSIRVGNEWYPYETETLLNNSTLALFLFVSAVFGIGLTNRKMDSRTAASFLIALMFGFMLFKSRRFIEYFPPFTLIFAAFAWAPVFRKEYQLLTWSSVFKKNDNFSAKFPNIKKFLQTNIPSLVLTIMLIFGVTKNIPAVQNQISKSKPYDLYQNASIWLQNNTQAGERVFQTDWDDFPRLFFYNIHNTYLIGLDPTYMQFYDEELYQTWVSITRGDIEEPSKLISSLFSAHYVHTDLLHQNFIKQAQKDSGLKEVYRDDQAIIYQVTQP